MIRGYGPNEIIVSEEVNMELIGIGDERNMMVIDRRKEHTMSFIETAEQHLDQAKKLREGVTDPEHLEVISEDFRRRVAATCIQCGYYSQVIWLISHLRNSDACAARYSNL